MDTQFRLLPEKTAQINNTNQKDRIRLSPAALINLGFEDKIQSDDGWFDSTVKIADFAPYMSDVEIKYNTDWAFDYALDFKVSRELEGKLKDAKGVIQNHEGNFYALFDDPNLRDTALRSVQGSTNDDDFYDQYGDKRVFTGSVNLGYHYTQRGSYYIWPPDIQLRPGDRYTMLVYGDKIAILDQSNPYYEKTYKFFQNYIGWVR